MIDPQLFVLVNEENTRQIFAFGIDTGEEAITFRRDCDDKTVFGVHTSVDSAHHVNSMMTGGQPGLKVIRFDCLEQWEDDEVTEMQVRLAKARGGKDVRSSQAPSETSPAEA